MIDQAHTHTHTVAYQKSASQIYDECHGNDDIIMCTSGTSIIMCNVQDYYHACSNFSAQSQCLSSHYAKTAFTDRANI